MLGLLSHAVIDLGEEKLAVGQKMLLEDWDRRDVRRLCSYFKVDQYMSVGMDLVHEETNNSKSK